jgi:hypothetical protein
MNMRISGPRGTTRPTAETPRTQQAHSWPAPTLGLSANGNIAVSQPGAAYLLENWYCTATGVRMRRGKNRYATLGTTNQPVRSLFGYQVGASRRMFGANDSYIFDLTVVSGAYNSIIGTDEGEEIVTDEDEEIGFESTTDLSAYPNTSGKWVVIQTQASDGSNYLIGVNGQDAAFIYDGTSFYPQVAGGLYTLSYDGGTTEFSVGETVTGGTSGATATVYRVIPTDPLEPEVAGKLWLTGIASGPFQDNEAITSTGGAALANGASALVPATNVTFSGGGLTTDKLSYVWIYKNRVFFVEKGTLNAWYHAVGQIAGELTKFSLGGQFKLGGYLMAGATWSRDTGSGLAAMCAFFSSEGEVAIFQGDNPGEADSWSIVGVYRIGKMLGPKSLMDAGGDLFSATDIGLVPLSRALEVDFSILGTQAVSEGIMDLWNDEVDLRSAGEWNIALWSRKQMVVVALPTLNDQPPRWLVANAKTKGWSVYSNWDATCLYVHGDQLYFGDSKGAVYAAEQTGLDDGLPYTSICIPAFDQMGTVGYKTVSMLRAVFRGPNPVKEKLTARSDYNISLPTAPASSPVSGNSTWGDATWGDSEWASAGQEKHIQQQWKAAYAGGEVHSAILQVTSGANIPLDTELIRIDATFTSGEVVV